MQQKQTKGGASSPSHSEDYTPVHTPIETGADMWLKRPDLYQFAGVRGGKVRSCRRLPVGAKMLITASSRHSPQMTIVARIAERMNIPARCHLPAGKETEEMVLAAQAGAILVTHRPGYNTTIIARAREDAHAWPDAKEIPFGMKCLPAVLETAEQVRNLPPYIGRIVVPVGSGISLAGILTGINTYRPDLMDIPILGVQVGADPIKPLNTFAPFGWQNRAKIIKAPEGYDEE